MKIKADEFPVNDNLIYLNNAAYCPVPTSVLKKQFAYLQEYSTMGPDSGLVKLDEYVDEARVAISKLINCEPNEIVFTESVTHGINLIAECYKFSKTDTIVLRETSRDHVANFLPWLKRSKQEGLHLYVTGSDSNGNIDLEKLQEFMQKNKGGVISMSHALYNIGTVLDVESVAKIAHENGYSIFVDAAQSIGCYPVDVKKLDCDFMAFSGYKWLCAPPGIGILYVKKSTQEKLSYFGMDVRSLDSIKEGVRVILKFSDTDYSLKDGSKKFEAGFRNYSGAVGLLEAINFINQIGIDEIRKRNIDLLDRAKEGLSKLPGIIFYGPEETKKRVSLSFNLDGVKSSELVGYLLKKKCILAAREIGSEGVVRISPHYYNTEEQIDKCIELIKNYINEK